MRYSRFKTPNPAFKEGSKNLNPRYLAQYSFFCPQTFPHVNIHYRDHFWHFRIFRPPDRILTKISPKSTNSLIFIDLSCFRHLGKSVIRLWKMRFSADFRFFGCFGNFGPFLIDSRNFFENPTKTWFFRSKMRFFLKFENHNFSSFCVILLIFGVLTVGVSRFWKNVIFEFGVPVVAKSRPESEKST